MRNSIAGRQMSFPRETIDGSIRPGAVKAQAQA